MSVKAKDKSKDWQMLGTWLLHQVCDNNSTQVMMMNDASNN
jgi:hypothetical protein